MDGSRKPASCDIAGGGYNEALILPARPRLADAPPAREELRGLDIDLPLEEVIRLRISLRRRVVHAPAVAPMDRPARHSGCLHAPPWHRLLRKQPSRDLREPAVLDSEPQALSRLWRARLGHHGKQRPRARHAKSGRNHAALSRICRARRAVWSRRWHAGSLGGRRVAAVRPRDRAPDPAALLGEHAEHGKRMGWSAVSIRVRVAMLEVPVGFRTATSRSIRGRSF